ncbi:MAG TPA: aminodeoxychorismate lyase [Gammaproteobacteria bacterium]|nr:aminodeoxychorismate lyase [Gammaproteobacteria bacterium]
MPPSDPVPCRTLINGVWSHLIPVQDRGFQYGDGLFETILVRDARLHYWQAHMQRLNEGCQRLKIRFPGEQLLYQEASMMTLHQPEGVLKVIVTRGEGGRGYYPAKNGSATRVLSMHALPDYSRTWSQQGISARICDQRLSSHPVLAGLKHLNRLEQVLARMEWDQQFQEGIMCDSRGNVVEGTMSNLFMLEGNHLVTPGLVNCGVAGIMRGQVIKQASKVGLTLVEREITIEALLASDGCFLTNSVIGLWPVRELQGRVWKTPDCFLTLADMIRMDA